MESLAFNTDDTQLTKLCGGLSQSKKWKSRLETWYSDGVIDL
jgi:hypothetical protein